VLVLRQGIDGALTFGLFSCRVYSLVITKIEAGTLVFKS
jgi:hypothetical protein